MNDTFFPTSINSIGEEMISDTPAEAAVATYGELLEFYKTGHDEIARLTERYSAALTDINDYRLRIANAGGVISDYYSECGEVTDELKQIAEYLSIPLTKRVSGTANFSISWSAQVPLDFDVDDFEISFDANCETYDADDFDWQEESCEVNGEEDF